MSKFLRNGEKEENTPYFEQSVYEVELDESEEIDHSVLSLAAYTQNNGTKIVLQIDIRHTYSIVINTLNCEIFTLGYLRLKKHT